MESKGLSFLWKALYEKISNRKRKTIIPFLCICAIAIGIEFFIIINSEAIVDYEYTGQVTNLYPSEEFPMEVVSYSISSDNEYLPLNNDPQLFFPRVEQRVESILLHFSKPIAEDTNIQVYYATPEVPFLNEEHSFIGVIKGGSSSYLLDIEPLDCLALRVDINGAFVLESIVVSDGDIKVISHRSESFNILRVICFLIFLLLGYVLLNWWVKQKETEVKLSKLELLYCGACFVFYFIWAISKPFNYGPDEYMRYDVSLFLYENNRLPRGIEAINPIWGFSYAHLPTCLCNLLSYIPMKLVGVFMEDSDVLVIAARMVSVCCATGVVYFVIKIAKLLFANPIRWIMVVLVSMIPQFVFLASYLNNDIVALFGSAMILYSWVLVLKKDWNVRNSVFLAFGISICALSYYNSYGWILGSIIFFFLSYRMRRPKDYKSMVKLGGLIAGIVVICIAYMFARHVVLYGDLLGLRTTSIYKERYGIAMAQEESTSLVYNGISLKYMLFDMKWLKNSYQSFIGCFGYMNVPVTGYVYHVYSMVFAIGGIGFVYWILRNVLIMKKKIDGKHLLFGGVLAVCIIIPIGLSVYRSYSVDFQSQGRYCYPAWLALALIVTKGIGRFMDSWYNEKQKYMVTGSICMMFMMITISEFFVTYL